MPAAKLFGEPSRLIQMVDIANIWIYFRYAKEKRSFLITPLLIDTHPQPTDDFCQ